MKVLTRARLAVTAVWQAMRQKQATSLQSVDNRGWHRVFESFAGAWQSNVEVVRDDVLAQPTLFACITLIAGDIGKCCLKLVERDNDGIWDEVQSPAFSPVLREPNHFQTMQLFIEQWVTSLLSNGNTYVLKVRDNRGVVIALYVLDACRVRPLVAPDGSVYYELQEDDLSKVPNSLPAIPASEIIHDRINCFFHPLVGLSPIFANGMASTQALKIVDNSAKFFANQSRPSGVLTAPAEISDTTAERLKLHWETNYSGDNIGKVAVLGDGLKYEAMTINPVDSQLVEQMKLSAEQVCATFHVPAYMVGAGPVPLNSNVQALTISYFGQCLQKYMKRIEDALDKGLGLLAVKDHRYGTMFDLDDLLRMDTSTLTEALAKQTGAGISKINEARRRLNLKPAKGGDDCYLQQQNYSLQALAKRDAGADPFGKATPAAAPAGGSDPAAMAAAEGAKAAADAATAEARALEQRIASTELFAKESDQAARAAAAEQLEVIKGMAAEARAERDAQAARAEAIEKAAAASRESEEGAAAEAMAAALIVRLSAMDLVDA